jgi:hypothetical protein
MADHLSTMQTPIPLISLDPPLKKGPCKLRIYEQILIYREGMGLSCPVDLGRTMPSLRFVQPTHAEVPYRQKDSVNLPRGAAPLNAGSKPASKR